MAQLVRDDMRLLHKVILLVMFGLLFGTQQGHAFESNNNNFDEFRNEAIAPNMWSCMVVSELDTFRQVAYVVLVDQNGDNYHAGGSEFYSGVRQTTGMYGNNQSVAPLTPISSAVIASCLGTQVSNITTFLQNGADGAYASDTYIGFK
jgi:hypothetical protein